MKYVLLLLSLVSLAYCAYSCSIIKPSTEKDCFEASRAENYSCCYLKATPYLGNGDVKKCLEVNTTYVEGDNKDSYIKYIGIVYKKIKNFVCE